MKKVISVASRASPLARAQCHEVEKAIQEYSKDVIFAPRYALTYGDRDLTVSLSNLDKTDFFTREIDEMVLEGKCRIAIHSAKDLPEPLTEGLQLIAITAGVDNSDALVLRQGESVHDLVSGAVIATSSARREENVKKLRNDFRFIDLRGTIEQRLAKLHSGEADGVVIAEAALIRLGLTHLNRLRLDGETAALQGKLAIVARSGDKAMAKLFAPLDTR